MALTRPWYTRGNIPFPDVSSALNSARSLLWLIKACLMRQVATGTLGPLGAAPGTAAWVCTGSSNSVAAGMDAVDRWGSSFVAANIVRAAVASPHSWIVLRHTTLGISICLDYGATVDTSCTVVSSYLEFTGGTTSARPTSAQEFINISQAQFHNANSGANHNFQCVTDAAGNFYFHAGQVGSGFVYLGILGSEMAEARAGDVRKFFVGTHFLNSGRGAPQTASIVVAGRTIGNSANITGGIIRPTFGGQTYAGGMEANASDSAFDTLPAAVGCVNVGQAGIRGRFPDVVIGGAMNVGGSDPTTGAQERACFGDIVTPHSVVPAL